MTVRAGLSIRKRCRRRTTPAAILFAALGASLGVPAFAPSALAAGGQARPGVQGRPVVEHYSTLDHGDIALIGNTSVACVPGTTTPGSRCIAAQNATSSGPFFDTGGLPMLNVNVDPAPGRFSSSSDQLALPPGAQVVYAGLEWGGMANGPGGDAANQIVQLHSPGASYQAISASSYAKVNGTGTYSAFADVTSIVQAGGSGLYTIANLSSAPTLSIPVLDAYGGWALAVVYRDSAAPLRTMSVMDGTRAFGTLTQGGITGLDVPVAVCSASGNASVGFATFDAHSSRTGDVVSLDGVPLSDALRPANNFFNSTISRNGVRSTSGNPNFANQLGFDLDRSDLPGALPAGATSFTISFTGATDYWTLGLIASTADAGPSCGATPVTPPEPAGSPDSLPTPSPTPMPPPSATPTSPSSPAPIPPTRQAHKHPVAARPRLWLTKHVSARSVTVSGPLTYVLTVTSVGSGSAHHVVVCDELPASFAVLQATGARVIGGLPCWTIRLLKPGQRRSFMIVVRLIRKPPSPRIRNVARARADHLLWVRATRTVSVIAPPVAVGYEGGVTG